VLQALNRAATNKETTVAFSSELALWMLTHEEVHRKRVDSLIGVTPSWAALCLRRLGETGRPFAETLASAGETMSFSDTKMQVAEAICEITRDKKQVLRTLQEIAHEMEHPTSTNSVGCNSGEQALGYAAHRFDDEPEFREAMRPLLVKALGSGEPHVVIMAKIYLERFRKFDQVGGGR
jgi:hypothetical protein